MAKSSKKTNTKQKRDKTRPMAIKKTAKVLGYSEIYVKMCINGTRDCKTCDIIKKEYQKIKTKIDNALAKVLND